MKTTKIVCAGIVCVAGCALSANAQMWPNTPGMMRHVMISLDSSTGAIGATLGGDPNEPVVLNLYAGETYNPPANVLDGKYYNSRYGWLNDGFVDPGAGNAIWIEATSVSAGLETYEGGMRPMAMMHTYAPIQGTAGSPDAWKWGGTMTHNWYAVSAPGTYEATYTIYVGDATTGVPTAGFSSADVTMKFVAVPAPSSALAFGVAGLFCSRRRRK